MQAQKIRKPKKDQEEAEEIAERIEELAQDEDFVYATLSGVLMEQAANQGKTGEPTETDENAEEKKAEPDEKEAQESKKQQGSKGSKGAGKIGQGRGQKGEKGEPEDEGTADGPGKDPRRDARERQEKIVDKARELEEKLKKLEAASDLAKAPDDQGGRDDGESVGGPVPR